MKVDNRPSSRNFLRWFDPRNRQIGAWGYILNRITALGLTLYLVLHLIMLFKVAQGQAAYDQFIVLAKTPVIKFFEMFVVAGGIIHGLNGIRIGMNSFGFGVRRQKELLVGVLVLSLTGIVIFALKMFMGD
jgi:succinate dehydrogenase / fumarate reductase, cytochrome b subunit